MGTVAIFFKLKIMSWTGQAVFVYTVIMNRIVFPANSRSREVRQTVDMMTAAVHDRRA